MDCAEIREALVRGAMPSSADADAHLAACPHCRELLAHNAELGRSLAAEAALPLAFPEELFEQLESRVAEESGLRAWLRSRPSKWRFALVASSVLAVVALGGVGMHRPDMSEYPHARLFGLLTAYALGIAVAFGKELFESVRKSSFADYGWLAIGALGLPFLVAFAPATEASRAFGPEGALGCFSFGVLLTLPTAVLLWALDRDDRLSLRTVCLSAAALGLAGSTILELHCPSGNFQHVILGHASIGVAWLGAWCLTRWWARARA